MTAPSFRFAAIAACSVLAMDAGAVGPDRDASSDGRPSAGAAPRFAPASPASGDPDLDRARAAAAAFSGRLRDRLQSAMQAGGPIAAVEVCHGEALDIAGAVMAEYGVRLGRVAAPGRQRNPAQAAGGWQLAALQAFQRAVDGGAPAAAQASVLRDGLPDGVALRMMRGIATEPVCLSCHGSHVAAPVRAAILARYPDDHATGFEAGDLRGALWVEVPAVCAPDCTGSHR